METSAASAHNFWHSLAEAEKPSIDQMNQGVHLQMLNKGDVIKFETLRSNDGYAFRVALEVACPKQGGVRVAQVVKFLGRLNIEVAKDGLGPGIRGMFVVRGDKRDGKALELGWIGIGADVCLTGGAVFRSVRNIFVNDSFIIFPPSSGTIQ